VTGVISEWAMAAMLMVAEDGEDGWGEFHSRQSRGAFHSWQSHESTARGKMHEYAEDEDEMFSVY
jgi:hypothetical protein